MTRVTPCSGVNRDSQVVARRGFFPRDHDIAKYCRLHRVLTGVNITPGDWTAVVLFKAVVLLNHVQGPRCIESQRECLTSACRAPRSSPLNDLQVPDRADHRAVRCAGLSAISARISARVQKHG